MLADGRQYLYQAPWLVLAPGVAIVAVAAAVTTLGRSLDRRWATDGRTTSHR
jgi:peptide/nickel transport system permease protein